MLKRLSGLRKIGLTKNDEFDHSLRQTAGAFPSCFESAYMSLAHIDRGTGGRTIFTRTVEDVERTVFLVEAIGSEGKFDSTERDSGRFELLIEAATGRGQANLRPMALGQMDADPIGKGVSRVPAEVEELPLGLV